jgi:hypothetical protein
VNGEAIKVLEEARIISAPSVYQPGDLYFMGELTFEVELPSDGPTSNDAQPEGTQ